MKDKIPQEIKNKYKDLGFQQRWYTNLRWRLCPFEKMEQYLPKAGIILDIGCGYGMFSHYLVLKSKDRQVIGIDNSVVRINSANLSAKNDSNIEFIETDILSCNLPKCQGASMSDFLHHLPKNITLKVLEKVYDALETNGRLVIEEVNDRPYWKYLSNLFIDNFLYPNQKINFKPAKEWQNILINIGFQVKIVSADKDLPLADVIFVCKKK